MKITGLQCAILGNHPILRISTDEGISGYSQIEASKADYIKSHVLFYESRILERDHINVESVMQRIRRPASFNTLGQRR